MEVQIKTGTIEQAITINKQITEFDNVYSEKEYRGRLKGKKPLILIAFVNNKAVGSKLGYVEDDYFYSWLGGVLPEYRNRGIAFKLAHLQEEMVKQMGIPKIRFKSQNKFKGMLIFAIKNGFSIIGTVPYDRDEGFKILLEKKLNFNND